MRGETQQSITTAAFETMEALRSAEIQRQLKALGSRDLQLWSIGALIIIVLAVGFGAVVVPNLTWQSHGAVCRCKAAICRNCFPGSSL